MTKLPPGTLGPLFHVIQFHPVFPPPCSRNIKPDAPSRQFLSGKEPTGEPETILPSLCIKATLKWDIEEIVWAASQGQPGPSAYPETRLFVLVNPPAEDL